ncbi:hypothetical protein RERY_21290 [Rhodococcus erythropolis]|nr:hypothetical protein RERY_21290 [Rhodococcus erythropolis]
MRGVAGIHSGDAHTGYVGVPVHPRGIDRIRLEDRQCVEQIACPYGRLNRAESDIVMIEQICLLAL